MLSKKKPAKRKPDLKQRNKELRSRLKEAEETLRAIREGEVDAVVVSGAKGEQIYSLVGAESIYRLIVETMKEAAFTVTFDGTILLCNAQFGEFVKRSMEQIVGHSLIEFVAEDKRTAASWFLAAARKQPVRQRFVFQAADGTSVAAHVSANVLNQPDGMSICVVASDLTELENSTELIQQLRKQQEALRQSEERFRLAVRATNDAIWDIDLVTWTVRWNETYTTLYGRPPETMTSWQWWVDHIHPDDRERAAGGLRSAIEGNELTWTCEYRFQRADGMWAHVYDRAYIARDESGKAWRVIGAMQDQTERKQAELRLKALMNALPIGVSYSDDPTCRSISGNPAVLAQFEVKPGDNLSAYATDISAIGPQVCFFREGRQIADAELPLQRAVAENREIPPMDLEVVLPSGRRWFAEASGAPVRDGLGNIIGGIAVTADVTDRKIAEEQLRKARNELEDKVRERTEDLRKANRTLRMISECNQLLFRAIDEEELIRAICRIIVELGGYRMAWVGYAENNEEKTVRPIASIGIDEEYLKTSRISWADNEQGRGPAGTCIRTGQAYIGRNFLEDRELAPWREAALKGNFRSAIGLPLVSRGKPFGVLTIGAENPEVFDEGRVALLRDLADDLAFGIAALRAQAERDQARQTAERRAEQLNAMAVELIQAEQKERQRLARILHDHLQQLLVGAKFSASAIRAKTSAKDIQYEAAQLTDTLDEAIGVSRSLSADLSPPILHEKGLKAGLEWLGRQMRQKHGLTVEVEADSAAEPTAEQVRLFLFDAVRELLLNVVKYANVDRAQVRTRTLKSGEIEITVADAGIGFDPSQLGIPDSATGGFGLFGIRERLSYLGGRMEIDAAPGKGSRFTLRAPALLAPMKAEKRPTAAKSQSVAPLQPTAPVQGILLETKHKIRLLLADDHPVMRQGLIRLLHEQPDMQVVGEAGDGRQAVELARQLKPDVVLMDIGLPGINGFDATQQIMSECPEIRVIGLSMHEETDMEDAMRKAGAVGYMTKGGPTERLVAAIREGLQKDSHKPSAATK